ncbi:MAG: hypothetical protein WCL06_14550 [Bacteroidota bacterium]
MSKHKKKKTNCLQLQKIAQAQARNEFFRRLRWVLAVMHCEHVFDLISERNLELMFSMRVRSLKVVGAKENTFDSDDLVWFKKAIVYKLRKCTIDLHVATNPDAKLDAYTFSTIGFTLKQFSFVIADHHLKDKPELFEIFNNFFEDGRHLDQLIEVLFDTSDYFCRMISDMRTRLYWTDTDSALNNDKHRIDFTIVIHSVIPEKIHLEIHKEKRTAVRLGYYHDTKVKWANIEPEKLGLRKLGENHLVDVYIQEHALHRLVERNDCVYVQYIWMALVISVLECNYHRDEYNGKYMIEFSVYEQKTGYLVAELVDGKLIIRTFLLLTNDGTPEGRMLHANTGLSKADKEYLKLDKLSTFLSPDIHNSENIKNIFTQAGCQSLFNLKAEFDSRNIMLRKPASASLIEDYLLLNEKKDDDLGWDNDMKEEV